MRGRRILVASLFLAGVAFAAPEKKKEKNAKPSRDWREVGTNHWQITPASPGEAPDVTDKAEGTRGSCSAGMVEVKGQMRVTPMGDELQKSICTSWINREFPERCASFDQAKWKAIRDKLPTKAMHFCIDRFEYPNKKGENPVIYVNFPEAETMCAAEKKRLCTEEEWTFACEGEDARPYPYGFDRDKDACITDKAWRPFDPSAYGKKETLVLELDRLWQGVPSGSQTKCKSPFGVYDMTGNVDEWTRSSTGGRKSILKGGYWGPTDAVPPVDARTRRGARVLPTGRPLLHGRTGGCAVTTRSS